MKLLSSLRAAAAAAAAAHNTHAQQLACLPRHAGSTAGRVSPLLRASPLPHSPLHHSSLQVRGGGRRRGRWEWEQQQQPGLWPRGCLSLRPMCVAEQTRASLPCAHALAAAAAAARASAGAAARASAAAAAAAAAAAHQRAESSRRVGERATAPPCTHAHTHAP